MWFTEGAVAIYIYIYVARECVRVRRGSEKKATEKERRD